MSGMDMRLFWDKVDLSGGSLACWLWTGALTTDGYGKVRDGDKTARAHRIAFRECNGYEPAVVDHECHNLSDCKGGPTCEHRRCINPWHLVESTKRDNTLASANPLASQEAVRTHCPQEHPYDEDNTYLDSAGRRHCRTCQRERDRARRKVSV